MRHSSLLRRQSFSNNMSLSRYYLYSLRVFELLIQHGADVHAPRMRACSLLRGVAGQHDMDMLARMCMLVEAILFTHGGASPVECEPYLQGRLSPLVPVCLYGRDATQEPVCAREQSVYYAWRDRAPSACVFCSLAVSCHCSRRPMLWPLCRHGLPTRCRLLSSLPLFLARRKIFQVRARACSAACRLQHSFSQLASSLPRSR